jgi:hypothetical protein
MVVNTGDVPKTEGVLRELKPLHNCSGNLAQICRRRKCLGVLRRGSNDVDERV